MSCGSIWSCGLKHGSRTFSCHNWAEAFSGQEGAKNKIRFMIGALRPPSLRTHMQGRVRFAKTLQDDVPGFLQELGDCIEGFERDLVRERASRTFGLFP